MGIVSYITVPNYQNPTLANEKIHNRIILWILCQHKMTGNSWMKSSKSCGFIIIPSIRNKPIANGLENMSGFIKYVPGMIFKTMKPKLWFFYIAGIFEETAENKRQHAKYHLLLLNGTGDTVAKIEAHHRERYKKLLEMVEAGTVHKREKAIKWKCSMCGCVHQGTEPPVKCPSCEHPRKFYEPANMDE